MRIKRNKLIIIVVKKQKVNTYNTYNMMIDVRNH